MPSASTNYRTCDPAPGGSTRVYGWPQSQSGTSKRTEIDVALVNPGGTLSIPGDFIAYLAKGGGEANDTAVTGGDILRGHGLRFRAEVQAQLTVIHLAE